VVGGRPGGVIGHVDRRRAPGAPAGSDGCAAQSDPVAQWTRAKHAAGDAITAAGATITHHHAIGTDHLRWMTAEIGELGVEILRAVKRRVDPVGILNPGKLIPPSR